jgi:hypothetical protein
VPYLGRHELVASEEAVTELAANEHLRIDTSGSLEQSLAALASAGVIADERSG